MSRPPASRCAARRTARRRRRCVFATTAPAYLDKTNATAIHAALGLPVVGRRLRRRRLGALVGRRRTAGRRRPPALAVLSDIRTGLPGGADERDGATRRWRFLFGEGDAVHRRDRRRRRRDRRVPRPLARPRRRGLAQWEERFGEHAYVPLAEAGRRRRAEVGRPDRRATSTTSSSPACTPAPCKRGGQGHRRSPRGDASTTSPRVIGNTGAAQAWPAARRRARPRRARPDRSLRRAAGRRRRRLACCARPTRSPLAEPSAHRRRADRGRPRRPRATPPYLTWRGFLRREPPRRPDPDRPAAPPSLRTEAWKYGFVGSPCTSAAFVHLPPAGCACAAAPSTRCTRCAWPTCRPPSPPTRSTGWRSRCARRWWPRVIDFDGGGRFQCELTDVDPATVAIGDRVEMTSAACSPPTASTTTSGRHGRSARGDTAGGS